MSRIGHDIVEIDANIRELAKDCRGKTELWVEEVSCALMGQDHPYIARRLFADYLFPEEPDWANEDLDAAMKVMVTDLNNQEKAERATIFRLVK